MGIAKILVADHDQDEQRDLCAKLRESGYEVIEAAHGAAVIQQGLAKRPDLAILDLELPVTCGMEAAECLYAEAGIPVLFLCRSDHPDFLNQTRVRGNLGCLLQPVDVESSLAFIQMSLQRAKFVGTGVVEKRTQQPSGNQSPHSETLTADAGNSRP